MLPTRRRFGRLDADAVRGRSSSAVSGFVRLDSLWFTTVQRDEETWSADGARLEKCRMCDILVPGEKKIKFVDGARCHGINRQMDGWLDA